MENTLVVEKSIHEIAKRANIEIDKVDLGITLNVAMNDEQVRDLVAMMGFLVGQQMEPGQILAELYHDLNAFKQIHLNPGTERCFSPRSAGYAQKVLRSQI